MSVKKFNTQATFNQQNFRPRGFAFPVGLSTRIVEGPADRNCEILVVAGGGRATAGGGGGGGLYYASGVPLSTAQSVTVGSGTPGAPKGGDSSIGPITAAGGGGAFQPGGSGGGEISPGVFGSATASPGGSNGSVSPASGWGNPGGPGIYNGVTYGGGGGGGAGGAGGPAPGPSSPGVGGIGLYYSISGSSVGYAGGGGGGNIDAPGDSTPGAINPSSPTAFGGAINGAATGNRGGGGGGPGPYRAPTSYGGSGVVIVRYNGACSATGGSVTTSGDDTIHTFTGSGTFTPQTTQTSIYVID
jgi:hypothetical protein